MPHGTIGPFESLDDIGVICRGMGIVGWTTYKAKDRLGVLIMTETPGIWIYEPDVIAPEIT